MNNAYKLQLKKEKRRETIENIFVKTVCYTAVVFGGLMFAFSFWSFAFIALSFG
jgi:hypothetical protein